MGVGGDLGQGPYRTLVQLANYSTLSVQTLRRALRDPDHPLPFLRYHRRIVVKLADFEAWLAKRGKPPKP